MENYFLVLLCALFTLSAAQTDSPPLAAYFVDDSPRHVAVGARNIGFDCVVNRNLVYMISNKVMIFRQPANESEKEVELSNSGFLIEGEPAFYDVTATTDDLKKHVKINFTIEQVRDLDDGKLLCRTVDARRGEMAEASVDIVVIRPLESLSLIFDGKGPISETTTSSVEVDAGAYSVQCIAEGSNPEATGVHLLLHGNAVDHSEPITELYFTDGVRKYRTTISGRVDLKATHSGQKIECTASSKANDNHVVKLPVKINVYDPKVTCNDSYAYPGKMYPILTCVVDHEGLDIKDYGFELGDSGEIVRNGEQNSDFVQVDTEVISPTRTIVHLKLYSAEDWHFNSDFVLLIDLKDGHTSKETVRLIKTADPGNSAPSVMSSLAVILFVLVASWLHYP